MAEFKKGIYPVMLTPYKDGKVDLGGVRELTNWYKENGCDGIFAVCQSSEMFYLSQEEKIAIAKEVVKTSAGAMTIVASGHTSDSFEAQAYELNKIAETGVDAVILVSNRLDQENEGDDVWLKNAEKLLGMLDKDVKLGVYECPKPYKWLLSPRILEWMKANGRFRFIKDTCCDPVLLTKRCEQVKGSELMLFNANGQTFLHSLKAGGAGYSGIIANYCPALFAWVYRNYEKHPEEAEALADLLSMLSFTEDGAYPSTAKYYLSLKGLDMTTESRVVEKGKFGIYQKAYVEQMYRIIEKAEAKYGK